MNAHRVDVYAVGLCYASACAPKDMPPELVERAVNLAHPTGVGPWTLSRDAEWASGDDQPSPCEREPGKRVHFLLEC